MSPIDPTATTAPSSLRPPFFGAVQALLRRLRQTSLVRILTEEELSPVEMEMRVRQVISLSRQTPMHALGNLGIGATTGWVFWDRLPHAWIILWLAAFAAFSALQLRRWWLRRRRPPPRWVSRRSVLRAAQGAFLAGALWGLAVGVAFPSDSLPHQMFLGFAVIGLSAGAMASMSMHPLACVAYVMPSLTPLLVLCALQRSPIAGAMAATTGIYVPWLMMALVNGHRTFADTVRTKVENSSLASGLAEAALASRAKSEFLANMSHELRTPLNAILGFSEVIGGELLGPVGTSRYLDYAADIYASGQHLLRIINDVLDMSKIEVGKLELREQPTNIGDAIRSSLALVAQRAVASEIRIETPIPPDLPLLFADELRIKQVILNLLTNAIKFTERGGSAEITAGIEADGRFAIVVSDTGIGMTREEVAIALEPFRQVDSNLARKYEGTGIGLPLTRALVELHGGKISIESERGRGTTVTCRFPADRVRSWSRRATEKPIPTGREVAK